MRRAAPASKIAVLLFFVNYIIYTRKFKNTHFC